MRAIFNNAVIETRPSLTLELLPGERMGLRPAPDLLAVRAAPGEQAWTILEDGLVLHEIGRYRFLVEHPDGSRNDLHLVCFEPELLSHIERHCRSLGHGGGDVDARKVRSVVRSLCTEPWFTGRVADVTDGNPARSLSHFGC
jgi:hypothetical protein